jgi:hypothetical protein
VPGNGHGLRGRECNRGTGCGKTARPGLCGGASGNRRSYRGGVLPDSPLRPAISALESASSMGRTDYADKNC